MSSQWDPATQRTGYSRKYTRDYDNPLAQGDFCVVCGTRLRDKNDVCPLGPHE